MDATAIVARIGRALERNGLEAVLIGNAGAAIHFVDQVSGVRSFEGIRKRARHVKIEGTNLMVADLSDIIKMKRAAGRAKDRAVLEILEKTLEATTNQKNKPSSA